MNTLGYISLELVDHVAQAPYQGPTAPCPWDAVDPLTRHGLRTRARALLTDAIPALIAAGWTPPPAAKDPDTCSCMIENVHDGTGAFYRATRTTDLACPTHGTATWGTGTFGACCSAPDCCGPGSYCCANAGPHDHPDEPDKPQ